MDIRKYMEKSVVDESDEGETDAPVAKKPKTDKQNSESSSNDTNDILTTVPQKEITEFLNQLLEHMDPKLDKLSHKLGAEKFNWNEIKFKNFTPEQCRNLWNAIQSHQRKYRTMRELVSDAVSWNTVPRKVPGQPKKPLSTYMVYFQKEFKKMKENDPTISVIQATKIISERFKTLSPNKKLKLQDEVKDSNETYKCKMALFKEEHPDLVGSTTKSKSKSSKEISTTTTRSPFKIFCDERLSSGSDDLKHLREEWTSLDDHQKVCFIHKSKREYLDRLTDNADLKPSVTKDEDKLYHSVLDVPIKPAGSAYALFSQEYLNSDEAKQFKSNKRMKMVSDKWKLLSEEQKKEFTNLAKEKNASYSAQYAAFLQRLSPEETNNFLKYHTLPDFLVYNAGDLVKTEIEDDGGVASNNSDDFPKSPKEYYRLKSKGGVKWKNLSDEEKEKWKKKFAKKQKKHIINNSIVSLGGNETE